AQFMVDLGDHMFVCNGSLSEARTQMADYSAAMQRYGGAWFMAMGNHECSRTPCGLTSTSANYVAFMEALSPVSSTPYYSINVETSLGRATFVFVADNAWSSAQSTWLDSTL